MSYNESPEEYDPAGSGSEQPSSLAPVAGSALPLWMMNQTFRVEHNPNCPSPFLVRLVSRGQGALDGLPHDETKDSCGYGQTLQEACANAWSTRSAPNTQGEA